MEEKKTWTIYWRSGDKTVITGPTIENAFSSAGYGGGAISAVDFYMEGDDSSYTYNKTTHEWEK